MLARHSLVWLTRAGWDRVIAGMVQPDRAWAMLWRDHDWPSVVRRSETLPEPDTVPLGLPLPPGQAPAGGLVKAPRLGCKAALADIRTACDAMPLESVLSGAPSAWQPALCQLVDSLRTHGLVPRVYGSLAFQHLTGRPYVRTTSDIDVLVQPPSAAQLLKSIEVLGQFAIQLPLDGEIVFPDGRAVAWREWQQAAQDDGQAGPGTQRIARVLAKRADGVELIEPRHLLAVFEDFFEVTSC